MRKGQCLTGVMLIGITTILLGETLTSEDVVLRLQSDDPQERQMAVKEILQERHRLLNDLETVAKEFEDEIARRETTKVSVSLLGKFRSVESAQFLIDNLTSYFNRVKSIRNPDAYFPCIDALIEIGSPSIEPLLTNAEENDDEMIINCSAFTLKRMLGKNIAAFCIQQRVQRQHDESKRSRLVNLQRYLDKWPELDK